MNSSQLDANRKKIEQRFPGLWETVLAAESPDPELEILPARNGSPTARKEGVFLHSRFNPQREADKLVASGVDRDTGCIILLGFGLGYMAEALSARNPNLPLVIVEPDPARFLAALKTRSLTKLWDHQELILVLAAPQASISSVLSRYRNREIACFSHRPSESLDENTYRGIRDAIKQFLSRRDINDNTLKKFGHRWVKNLSRNLKTFESAGAVEELFDRFAGMPVFLAAAGPTLNQVLPRLKEIQPRAVIVCVDTSLRLVLSRGIVPDFVVVVDPQYWNARHLDFCSIPESTILISESSTYPSVFRSFKGRTYLCKSVFALGQYFEEDRSYGSLGTGGSVATTAWDFCRRVGANRIYVAGLDLGFPEKETHCRGSYFEERAHTMSRRFSPAETAGFLALKSGDPVKESDYRGEEVLSDRRLLIYKWWFESHLSRYSNPETAVLSDRGVMIPGMKQAKIDDLIMLPVIRAEIDAVLADLSPGTSFIAKPEPTSLARNLADDLAGLERLCEEQLDLCRKIRTSSSSGSLWTAMSKNDEKILHCTSKSVASFLIQPVIQKILQISHRSWTEEETLNQSEELYRELKRSASTHKNCFDFFQ